MWVTPDRYESCLGEAVTQAVAGRPRSCRLTDGLGLRVELWVRAWSRPPWGSVGLAHRGPRLAFSAEGIETAEWLQNRGGMAVVVFVPPVVASSVRWGCR